jgi:hypothetical protein
MKDERWRRRQGVGFGGEEDGQNVPHRRLSEQSGSVRSCLSGSHSCTRAVGPFRANFGNQAEVIRLAMGREWGGKSGVFLQGNRE